MQVVTRLDERINSIADAGIINQEAIIRMIANKESNESSVIEGTQTMIEDAFSDIKLLAPEKRENAEELQNYIKALDYGIDNLSKIPLSEDKEPGKLPLSERLIKSIHEKLNTEEFCRLTYPSKWKFSIFYPQINSFAVHFF